MKELGAEVAAVREGPAGEEEDPMTVRLRTFADEYTLAMHTAEDAQAGLDDYLATSHANRMSQLTAEYGAEHMVIQAIQQKASSVATAASVTSSVLSTIAGAITAFGGEQEKAQKAALIAQQVAAARSIVMATAENVSKAAAMFAFPSPAGIAAVAAVGGLGAAQLAILGKQTATGLSEIGGSTLPSPYSSGSSGTVTDTQGAVSSGSTGDVSSGLYKSQNYTPVSDAYFGPSAGPQLFQTTPGDDVIVNRSVPNGSSGQNAALLSEQRRGNDIAEKNGKMLEALMNRLMYSQQRRATVGPARNI